MALPVDHYDVLAPLTGELDHLHQVVSLLGVTHNILGGYAAHVLATVSTVDHHVVTYPVHALGTGEGGVHPGRLPVSQSFLADGNALFHKHLVVLGDGVVGGMGLTGTGVGVGGVEHNMAAGNTGSGGELFPHHVTHSQSGVVQVQTEQQHGGVVCVGKGGAGGIQRFQDLRSQTGGVVIVAHQHHTGIDLRGDVRFCVTYRKAVKGHLFGRAFLAVAAGRKEGETQGKGQKKCNKLFHNRSPLLVVAISIPQDLTIK